MTRSVLSAVVLAFLFFGCQGGTHTSREVGGLWVGFTRPQTWEVYRGLDAYKLPDKNKFHFQILRVRESEPEQALRALGMMRQELQSGPLTNQSMMELDSALQTWSFNRSRKHDTRDPAHIGNASALALLSRRIDPLQMQVQQGKKLAGSEAKKLVDEWETIVKEAIGDEVEQRADFISSMNGFISFSTDQVTTEPLMANGLQGTLYHVPTGSKPYKFAVFPLDDKTIALEFHDMYEPDQIFREVPGILDSLQIGMSREDVQGTRPVDKVMSLLLNVDGDLVGRMILFGIYCLFTALPAALAASAQFRRAQNSGAFAKEHREAVQSAVIRTTAFFLVTLGGLATVGMAHDYFTRSRGSLMVGAIALVVALFFGFLFFMVVGIGGGVAAGYAASWGYRRHSKPLTVAASALAAVLAPVGLAIVAAVGAGLMRRPEDHDTY